MGPAPTSAPRSNASRNIAKFSDTARRRTRSARSASDATMSSTRPLSAVGSRRIRSSETARAAPRDEAEEPAQLPVAVVRLDQHAVAVQPVAQPAERHREAPLVAAVTPPLRRRRVERRELRRVERPVLGHPRGVPLALQPRHRLPDRLHAGPVSENARMSRIASSPISHAVSPASV